MADTRSPVQESGTRPIEHGLHVPSATVLRGAASLRQLRDRVQALVKELERLRKINRESAERIAELESPKEKDSETVEITFESDKEQLRTRVNAFIKAIDDYLTIEEESTNS